MPTDVRPNDGDTGTGPAGLPITAKRARRWAWLLLGTAAWNVWLWVTRAWNLANDPEPRDTSFVVVHAVLYVVSLVLAVAVGVVGWRLRSAAGRADA